MLKSLISLVRHASRLCPRAKLVKQCFKKFYIISLVLTCVRKLISLVGHVYVDNLVKVAHERAC